jgi:hypothetical protein
MKKSGAKANAHSILHLAKCIQVAQEKHENSPTPPRPTMIIRVIAELDKVTEPWPLHKPAGPLLTVLKTHLVKDTNLGAETIETLIGLAKNVFARVYPISLGKPPPERDSQQIGYDLQHFLECLVRSRFPTDWRAATDLLPMLHKYRPGYSHTNITLSLSARVKNSNMAKESYFEVSRAEPFNPQLATEYMFAISRGWDSKSAIRVLDEFIEHHKPSFPERRIYFLALMSCVRLPNIHPAIDIFNKAQASPYAKDDFGIQFMMLDILLRGTTCRRMQRKMLSPNTLCNTFRKIDIPSAMRTPGIPMSKKLALLDNATTFVEWMMTLPQKGARNMKHPDVLRGDIKFFERWREIVTKWGDKIIPTEQMTNDIPARNDFYPPFTFGTKSRDKPARKAQPGIHPESEFVKSSGDEPAQNVERGQTTENDDAKPQTNREASTDHHGEKIRPDGTSDLQEKNPWVPLGRNALTAPIPPSSNPQSRHSKDLAHPEEYLPERESDTKRPSRERHSLVRDKRKTYFRMSEARYWRPRKPVRSDVPPE